MCSTLKSARRTFARDPGGHDELALPQRQRGAPRDAGEYTGMLKMPMAMMALIAPAPKMAVIRMAITSEGKGKDQVVAPHDEFIQP